MSRSVYIDVCEQFTRCVAALPSPRPALPLLYTRQRDRAPTHRVAVSTPPSNTQESRPYENDLQSKERVDFMTLSEN